MRELGKAFRLFGGLLSSLAHTRSDARDRDLVLVTAADSSHFKSVLQFLGSATSQEPSAPLFFWDLGLTDEQSRHLKNAFPQVNYRKFAFSQYPPYFDIRRDAGQYAWKPVVISLTADELGPNANGPLLLWCDSGNIVLRRLDWVRRYISAEGVFSPFSLGTLAQWTHPLTSAFFGFSEPELGLRNANGALVGFDLADARGQELLNRWAVLAQVKDVIAPEGSNRSNHRQDQALLSCLLVASGYKDFRYRDKWAPEYKLQWDID